MPCSDANLDRTSAQRKRRPRALARPPGTTGTARPPLSVATQNSTHSPHYFVRLAPQRTLLPTFLSCGDGPEGCLSAPMDAEHRGHLPWRKAAK